VGGQTLLARAVVAFREAGIDDVLVVTGHRHAEVGRAAQALSASPVHNERFDRGMYSSVQAGVRALPPAADRFFVLPVDCAFVRPETLGRLVRAARTAEADIAYPVAGDRRGHPPLVSAALAPAVLAGDDPDGLRGVLRRHAAQPAEVAVTDPGVLFDADTAADLTRAGALARANALPDEAACARILVARSAPPGLVAHSRAVMKVAVALASALNASDQHVCLRLITAAALLHDVARAERDHASAGAALIGSLGYPRVAEVVKRHVDLGAGAGTDIGEAEIVFLADKLVLGERTVTLEERFAPRLREFGDDPRALAAVQSRLAAAQAVRARVEAALGRPLTPVSE
jgi:CTP:molybdopterin cytidylyltransferase MocA